MNNAGPTHLRKQYEANKLINRHLTAPVIKNVKARTESDVSQVFKVDDISAFWLAISEIIRVKMPNALVC
jgi:flavin reductase (DIM6/NTAB) family NADH-FMN oxidoreductase RutF